MNSSFPSLSCSVVIDSRINPSGLSKIYFRLSELKVKRDIATGIRWPCEFFDKKNQQLMPRHVSDPDVVPLNLRLNEFKAIAHRLQLSGYLKDASVTMDDLVKEFKNAGKTSDFFMFMQEKANELYNGDVIANGTWRRHISSLNTVKKFHKSIVLPISSIDLDWIERFDAWARKVHKRAHETLPLKSTKTL